MINLKANAKQRSDNSEEGSRKSGRGEQAEGRASSLWCHPG